MTLDQLHEQNIETIKCVSGATRILNREEESALIRWEQRPRHFQKCRTVSKTQRGHSSFYKKVC